MVQYTTLVISTNKAHITQGFSSPKSHSVSHLVAVRADLMDKTTEIS